MPVAKEQIRQIIADNNLNSVADVYTLLRDGFKDILQELMEAELDATLGYEKNNKGNVETSNKADCFQHKVYFQGCTDHIGQYLFCKCVQYCGQVSKCAVVRKIGDVCKQHHPGPVAFELALQQVPCNVAGPERFGHAPIGVCLAYRTDEANFFMSRRIFFRFMSFFAAFSL